jgi:hypothetical protein
VEMFGEVFHDFKIWFPILGFFSNKCSAFVVTNVGITENADKNNNYH